MITKDEFLQSFRLAMDTFGKKAVWDMVLKEYDAERHYSRYQPCLKCDSTLHVTQPDAHIVTCSECHTAHLFISGTCRSLRKKKTAINSGEFSLRYYDSAHNENLLAVDCKSGGIVMSFVEMKSKDEFVILASLPEKLTQRRDVEFIVENLSTRRKKGPIRYQYWSLDHMIGDSELVHDVEDDRQPL